MTFTPRKLPLAAAALALALAALWLLPRGERRPAAPEPSQASEPEAPRNAQAEAAAAPEAPVPGIVPAPEAAPRPASALVVARRPAGFPDLGSPVPPAAAHREASEADIAAALGEAEVPTTERFRAAERLIGSELTSAQLDHLLAALARPQDFDGLRVGPRRGLLNELLKVFYLREPIHPGFVETLRGVVEDPAQDEVVRDYYLQALGLARPSLGDESAAAAESALRASLAHEGTSLPGTALLALGRQHRAAAEPDPARAAALLEDARALFHGHSDERSRIAAAQVLAEFRDADSAAALAAAAQDSRASAALRLAAVHALRAIDPAAAEAALRAAAGSGDPLLAATAARLLSKTPATAQR